MKGSTLLRAVRTPAIVLAVYLILRAVFDRLTEREGLISPTGAVSVGVALLGAGVIVLRVVVIFVLPAVVVHRLVARLLDRGARGG